MTGTPTRRRLRRLAALGTRRAAARRLRFPRRLLLQPARRRRRRRRPVHRAGGVPRRARPRAAVRRQGRRRPGRAGSTRSSCRTTGRRWSPLTVNGDVDLPANAVAKIQQSSLLGEKFVELAAPGNEKPEGKLRDHPRIPLARTNRNVEVEELLGALSLVLNGGGAGPAADDQPGARARRCRAGSPPSAARSPSWTRSSAASTPRSRRSTGRWTARTPSPARWPRAPARSTRRWTTSAPAWTSSTSSATCSSRCCRAWPASATSARGSSTSPRPTPSPTCSCSSRSSPSWPRPGRPGRLAGPAAHLPVPGQLGHRHRHGGPPAELPAGPAHRRLRAVHQHDGDGRAGPHPDPVPVRDRPGDRRPEDAPARGHPDRHLRPGRHPAGQPGAPAAPGGSGGGTASAEPPCPATSSARCPDPNAADRHRRPPDDPGGDRSDHAQDQAPAARLRAWWRVLGMSYLGFKYVGLDRLILGSGYDVAADFKDSGGIFVNAEVTYRGVAVGRVSDMKLIDDGVRVVLTMEPGRRQDPGRHQGDRRHAQRRRRAVRAAAARRRQGAVPEGRVGHPEEPHLDPGAGRAAAAQHGQARGLAGPGATCGSSSTSSGRRSPASGDDLGRLIDNGNLLLARAEQSLPQTLKLITDGQTVLDTQNASRSAIQ